MQSAAHFQLIDEAHASRFGAALGLSLRPGDTVMLKGPLGAGKSHIARAAIRAIAGDEIDVPSPTFTLVQVYDTPVGEVWHADLYRLTDPDEVVELGLLDAMDSAICLIEWPERMNVETPEFYLWVVLDHDGDQRSVTVMGADDDLVAALEATA
jgi:tRNA threonylcarbamoyladenosine biosynthesis protein TsaE